MISNFLIVAGQVVTLFLLMGVGFVVTKLGKMSRTGTQEISYLCLYIVCPCLIVDSMQTAVSPGLLHSILIECAVVAVSMVGFILVSRPLFPSRNEETRSVLRFGMVFGNVGFMGFPLIQAILGEGAMLYTVFYLIVYTVFNWTYGVALMGGKMSLRKMLLNPGTVGLYCGLPLLLTGHQLTGVIGNTVGFLADLNTPLAMVVIGSQMARANIRETLGHVRLFEASAVRMVLLPLLVMLCLLPLHLDPVLFVSIVVLSATPTAGVTSMFAETYRRNTAAAAQQVTLSTLLSLVTLPLFAAGAELLAGI